jgi:hypothetical protein
VVAHLRTTTYTLIYICFVLGTTHLLVAAFCTVATAFRALVFGAFRRGDGALRLDVRRFAPW